MRRINRCRERKERLRKASEEAAAKWQALNPAEQLKELDLRFGEGKGAGRQRARIAAKFEARRVEKAAEAQKAKAKAKSKGKKRGS